MAERPGRAAMVGRLGASGRASRDAPVARDKRVRYTKPASAEHTRTKLLARETASVLRALPSCTPSNNGIRQFCQGARPWILCCRRMRANLDGNDFVFSCIVSTNCRNAARVTCLSLLSQHFQPIPLTLPGPNTTVSATTFGATLAPFVVARQPREMRVSTSQLVDCCKTLHLASSGQAC
ncbi:hypothetical protein MRX96_010373 [Rhipicephalus microplus]